MKRGDEDEGTKKQREETDAKEAESSEKEDDVDERVKEQYRKGEENEMIN